MHNLSRFQWKNRVVIPFQLPKSTLEELHNTYPGIEDE